MAQSPKLSIPDAVRSYIELHLELMKDFAEASEQLVQSPNKPFIRRTYIRSLFALIEGETFARKQIALEIHRSGNVSFSNKELEKLTEKGSKGKKIFLPIRENMPFSFEAFAKACEINYKLDYSMVRKKENRKTRDLFQETIDCRNRITHPKRASEFSVNDEEIEPDFSVS